MTGKKNSRAAIHVARQAIEERGRHVALYRNIVNYVVVTSTTLMPLR